MQAVDVHCNKHGGKCCCGDAEDPVDNIDPPVITLRDAHCHIRAVSTFLSHNLTILKNKELLQATDGIKSSLDRMVTSVHHQQATLDQWIDD